MGFGDAPRDVFGVPGLLHALRVRDALRVRGALRVLVSSLFVLPRFSFSRRRSGVVWVD